MHWEIKCELSTATIVHNTKVLPVRCFYHWGGEGGKPEWACIADLIFCHGRKIMDNSRICHCLLFNEHGEQNLEQPFSLVKEATTATPTLRLNFTMKSWAESLALMSVIMHGLHLKWTRLLCVIWHYCTVCEQPALVCHGPQSRSVDPSAWS